MRASFVFAILCLSSINVFSQKAHLTKGSAEPVKIEKSINILFGYDDMKVGKITEAEYVGRKVKENNADKPGKGDNWFKKWKDDRKEVYEPAFNKYFKKTSKLDVLPESKYTLIFHTRVFEPGFNSLVERIRGYIEGQAVVVETTNPSNVIAVIEIDKVVSISLTETYTVAARLEVCYATAGSIIGKLFK